MNQTTKPTIGTTTTEKKWDRTCKLRGHKFGKGTYVKREVASFCKRCGYTSSKQ